MSQLRYQDKEQILEEEEISIDCLLAHGISAADIHKLKQAGVNTCNSLLQLTNQDLRSTGVAKLEKICEAAQKLVSQGLTTASDVMPNTQLKYQVQSDEEDVSSISIDMLLAHGINPADIQKLKQAGFNTCNSLLKLTNEQVTSTGVAKVEKICEAANNLVKQQSLSSASDALPNMIVLCDEAVTNNILEKQKLDFAVKMFQKKVGGEVNIQLAVTECTELSLVKSNVILKDTFLTERCGHNPPISSLDCLAKTAKAKKNYVAAGSDDVFNQLLFHAPHLNLFYAKNLNNIHLCPALTQKEMDRSSSEEEEVVESEPHKKKKLKRG